MSGILWRWNFKIINVKQRQQFLAWRV
jgi:hypothetical protein